MKRFKKITAMVLTFALVIALGSAAPKAAFADAASFHSTFESGAASTIFTTGTSLAGETFSTVVNGEAKYGTLVGNVGGAAFGAVNVGRTVHSLATDGLTSHSQGGQLVQAVLISVDLTFGMVGIAMALGGAAMAPGVLAVAFGVGMLTAFLSSETGGQLLDNPSQWFSQFIDDGRIKPPNDTNVYKPNIYIYTDERTELSLSFEKPELVTVTIPEYKGSWDVVSKDGILSVSGSSYEYLFYEALTDKELYSYDKAFLIPKEGRADALRQVLAGYNFTKMEIEDFIAFWDSKLGDEDFLMYPQLTDVIDANMPIQLSAELDEYFRIWFAFDEYDGQSYEKAEAVFFERSNSSTLLEWGGFIID